MKSALIRAGGVYAYEAKSLIPDGLDQLPDYKAETLLGHALGKVETGLRSLRTAIAALGELLDAVGELEPPPVIWQADEAGLLFATRDQASEASHAAAPPDAN